MQPHELDEREHADILQRIIQDKLDPIPSVGHPRLYLLGGQPGSGKTALRRPIRDAVAENGLVDIDPDELKTYHPKYVEFIEEDAETASRRTRPDVAKWLLELRDAAFRKRVNLLFDAPLGAAAEPVDWASNAHAAGYEVEVHVMAVPWEVSFQAVRERFELSHDLAARYEGPPESRPLPRNVREESQRANYDGLIDSVGTISRSGLIARLRITNRRGDTLADMAGVDTITAAASADTNPFPAALQAERNRPWRPDEIAAYFHKAITIERLMTSRLARTAGPELDRLADDLAAFRERHRTVIPERANASAEGSGTPVAPVVDASGAADNQAFTSQPAREGGANEVRATEVWQHISKLPIVVRGWLERCCCIPQVNDEEET
jgi:predicted ABC-type ATPase